MSTVYLDKRGKVIKTDPGTRYHPEGTGPRNADGTPIVDTTPATDDAGAADADAGAAVATTKDTTP